MPAISPTALSTIKPRTTLLIVLCLLTLFSALVIASVRQESQTFDEANHLYEGFEYWKHGDFGRNPEHPPLVKLLAAIPLLPMGLKEPPPIAIPFFKVQDVVGGAQLLYTANADVILFRGRLVVALFGLALGVLVFLAGREMFDSLTGLIALGLFSLEPVILANSALVTTDIPLTCVFFAAVYAFYRYIRRPSLLRLALCAAVTAIGVVTKHSGLLIIPILFLLGLAEFFIVSRQGSSYIPMHSRERVRRLAQGALAFAAIILVSYVVLWAFYGFRYAARPGDLQITPSLAAYSAGLTHPLQRSLIDFAARHHLFPEAYLFGWVDILSISGNRPTFLFGHVNGAGVWYFFPGVFFIKTSLTLMILLLLLPFARIRGHRREFLFLMLPVGFYMLVAIFSMLNMGSRHLLPIYPFCIVLAGAAAASFATRSNVTRVAVAALLLLSVVSSLHAFPNFLAYSNELVGGPSNTHRVIADSDADWGQGLKWTKAYLDKHPASDCWFDFYNPFLNPTYYGIQCKPLTSGFGHVIGIGPASVPSRINGTILISGTDLAGAWWGPDSMNPYRVLGDRRPDAVIENIIFVYHGSFDVPLLAAQTSAIGATSMMRQHRFPEAVALAQTAVQEAPDSAEIRAVLGQSLLASGRTLEGQRAIATAMQLAQANYPEYQRYLLHSLEQPSQ